jgi:hypothetical protein
LIDWLNCSQGTFSECPLWVESGHSFRPSHPLDANVRFGWKATSANGLHVVHDRCKLNFVDRARNG